MEKDVETHLRKQVKNLGGKALKFPAFWVTGIPDRLLVLPNGMICWVETKQASGDIKPHQHRRINWLRDLGFWVEVIWTKDEVDELIKRIRLLI